VTEEGTEGTEEDTEDDGGRRRKKKLEGSFTNVEKPAGVQLRSRSKTSDPDNRRN